MNFEYTYQQDTTKVVNQDASSVQTGIVTDTLQVDSQPPPPTKAQIRYWRWLREKKLTVGDSRYIKSKDDVQLITSVETNSNGLELPIHEKNRVNSDWITILFIVVAILVASIRITYSKYVGHLFQSLVNYSTSFRMFREKNYTILHAAYRLEILFYLAFSVFLFQVITQLKIEFKFDTSYIFLVSLGFVVVYFFVKKAIYSIVGLILEGVSETNEYLFNMDNNNRVLGLVLVPIIALINYYPAQSPLSMVLVGVFVVGIFYVFLLQRGILILMNKQFSIFYLFLYLCTLEFLPLLLIYKIAVE